MNANAALKRFQSAIAEVKRFGVRVTNVWDWGVEKNGDWHSENGHVCACGALVLACNPQVHKNIAWTDEGVIAGVQKVLKCTASQAWAVSEGFEGDVFGDQSSGGLPKDKAWYKVGKALRRHIDKQEL